MSVGRKATDDVGRAAPARTRAGLSILELSSNAVQIYERMLVDDEWSMCTLASVLGIDREAFDDAVAELESHQLLVRSDNGPSVRVVSPQVGLNRLLDTHESELRRRQDDLSVARRAAESLILRADDARAESTRTILETVAAGAEIANVVSEILGDADTEVLTMLTILPSPQSLEYAASSDAALLARGVRARLIVLDGHLTRSPELVNHVERLIGLGVRVRVATTLPHRMIVVDGRTAVLPVDLRDETAGGLIARQPTLVGLALNAFEHSWQSAHEFAYEATEPADVPLNRMQLEILRLLAEGGKDDTVARRLGISARTVRRLISEASESVGVDSRFQLAAEAARRGLV